MFTVVLVIEYEENYITNLFEYLSKTSIRVLSFLVVTCQIVSTFISSAIYFMVYSCKTAAQKNLHKFVYCCIHRCNCKTKNLQCLPLQNTQQEFIIKRHQVHPITKVFVLFNVLKHI